MMLIPSGNRAVKFNYSQITACQYVTEAESCIHHIQKDHLLVYIYSGEFSLHDGINEHTFGNGNCVFIRKNHRTKFSIRTGESDHIKIVFLIFNRNFLIEFYQQIDKLCITGRHTNFSDSFLTIPIRADIESLFYSMIPYLNSAVSPSENVMRLKLTEGIFALLNVNNQTSAVLFDFIDPWKIDMLDFLNENFMFDLSLKEIALFTGRSIASFKRDFKKISALPPMKWITNKRLEAAHQQLKDEARLEARQVSDIYLNVGFKSLSHFSTAYKKKYGVAPTRRKTGSVLI